jgi:hypothetical protein
MAGTYKTSLVRDFALAVCSQYSIVLTENADPLPSKAITLAPFKFLEGKKQPKEKHSVHSRIGPIT